MAAQTIIALLSARDGKYYEIKKAPMIKTLFSPNRIEYVIFTLFKKPKFLLFNCM